MAAHRTAQDGAEARRDCLPGRPRTPSAPGLRRWPRRHDRPRPGRHAADHAPYALSAPDNLEASLTGVGLNLTGSGEVVCRWRYLRMENAIRALLCSAGGARAVEAAGENAVRDVLNHALRPFQEPQTAVVSLVTTFRWVAASRRS